MDVVFDTLDGRESSAIRAESAYLLVYSSGAGRLAFLDNFSESGSIITAVRSRIVLAGAVIHGSRAKACISLQQSALVASDCQFTSNSARILDVA